MSSAHSILSRALNDRFNEASNAISLAQDFIGTLHKLVRASNLAFTQGDPSIGGSRHFILDINEQDIGTPLRPKAGGATAIVMNLYDSCTSDLRARLAPVAEAGLALVFKTSGEVTALTTKKILLNEGGEDIKPVRSESFRIQKPNALEGFVASWLRGNLDSKTMVEIQNQLERQDQKDCEAFSWMSPEQFKRLAVLEKAALK